MGEKSKPAPFRVGDKVNLAKSTDVLAGVQSKVYYSITYISDGQYVNSKVSLSKTISECVSDVDLSETAGITEGVTSETTDIIEGVTSETAGITEGVTSETKGVDYADLAFATFYLVFSVVILLSPIEGETGRDIAISAVLILVIVFAIKVALDKIFRWFLI